MLINFFDQYDIKEADDMNEEERHCGERPRLIGIMPDERCIYQCSICKTIKIEP